MFFFSCGDNYRGTYCEYENPCRPELGRCLNGGECNILMDESGIDAQCECALGKIDMYINICNIDCLYHNGRNNE